MKRKNFQRVALLLALILAVMVINNFYLYLVELFEIENYHPFYDFFRNSESIRSYTTFWTYYWGLATSLILLLIVIGLIDYFQPRKKEEEQSQKKKIFSIAHFAEKRLTDVKIEAQRNYLSIANSQAVRLLGSIAALFTFIQVIQNLNIKIAELGFLKITFFLVVVFFLTFFSFRAFFKYSVFAMFAANVVWMNNEDINNMLEFSPDYHGQNLIVLLNWATALKIAGKLKRNSEKKYRRLKIYGFFPYDWFIYSKRLNTHKWGIFLCLGLTGLSILILIGILW